MQRSDSLSKPYPPCSFDSGSPADTDGRALAAVSRRACFARSVGWWDLSGASGVSSLHVVKK